MPLGKRNWILNKTLNRRHSLSEAAVLFLPDLGAPGKPKIV